MERIPAYFIRFRRLADPNAFGMSIQDCAAMVTESRLWMCNRRGRQPGRAQVQAAPSACSLHRKDTKGYHGDVASYLTH